MGTIDLAISLVVSPTGHHSTMESYHFLLFFLDQSTSSLQWGDIKENMYIYFLTVIRAINLSKAVVGQPSQYFIVNYSFKFMTNVKFTYTNRNLTSVWRHWPLTWPVPYHSVRFSSRAHHTFQTQAPNKHFLFG